MNVNQGEIYAGLVHDPQRRPVIVISRDELNRGDYVVCVPCTKTRFEIRSQLPNCVPFEKGQFGMA